MDYFRKKNIAISHFQSHYIDSEVIYRLFYRFTVSTSYLFGDKVCRSDFFQEPTVQLLTMHKITDIRVFSVVCNLFSFVSFSFSLSLVQSSKSLKWWINDLKQTEIVQLVVEDLTKFRKTSICWAFFKVKPYLCYSQCGNHMAFMFIGIANV